MTDLHAIATTDIVIKAWRADELAALRAGDAARAHLCHTVIEAFLFLRTLMLEPAVAA